MNQWGGGGAVGRMQGLLGCSCVSYIKMLSHEGSNSDQLEVLFCFFQPEKPALGSLLSSWFPFTKGMC